MGFVPFVPAWQNLPPFHRARNSGNNLQTFHLRASIASNLYLLSTPELLSMASLAHLAGCPCRSLPHTASTPIRPPSGRAVPSFLQSSRGSPATRNLERLSYRPCLGTDTSGAESAALTDHAKTTQDQAAVLGSDSNSSLSLEPSDNHSALRVFGLTHLSADSEPAEWIWQHKPSAVIFETAVNPSHGSQTGSVLTASSTEQAETDFRMRMFLQIASQLSDATSQPSSESQVWQMVKQQFPGEQLAYITALAVGAELVFGDRCKSITYQRLQNIPSLKDLDAAYGRLSADNYQDLLHKKSPSASASQSGRLDADGSNDSRGHADCVRTILTSERDLVLASSMIKAAEHVGKEGRVAAVVGAAHMAGVQHHLYSPDFDGSSALKVLQSETPAEESPQQQGVRRALLTSCLALCCPSEVVADCMASLGELPSAAQESEQQATEIYGSTRMLLAVLSEEELREVCSGWDCDMHEILSPVRAMRPGNGGPGVDEDVLWDHVRDLSLLIG